MIKSKKAKKKSKKKVTFEKDLMKEDVNLDALQDEDEEAGGAILDDVKVKNVETSRPLYDDVKLPVHLTPASSIQYQDYMTSTLNMIPRIEYAYFQYAHHKTLAHNVCNMRQKHLRLNGINCYV